MAAAQASWAQAVKFAGQSTHQETTNAPTAAPNAHNGNASPYSESDVTANVTPLGEADWPTPVEGKSLKVGPQPMNAHVHSPSSASSNSSSEAANNSKNNRSRPNDENKKTKKKNNDRTNSKTSYNGCKSETTDKAQEQTKKRDRAGDKQAGRQPQEQRRRAGSSNSTSSQSHQWARRAPVPPPPPGPAPPPPPPPQRQANVAALRQQVEYYFSIDNLCKDIYLRSSMDSEGWVPLDLIAQFNRVRMLLTDAFLLMEALTASTELEISPAQQNVRRAVDGKSWALPPASQGH